MNFSLLKLYLNGQLNDLTKLANICIILYLSFQHPLNSFSIWKGGHSLGDVFTQNELIRLIYKSECQLID